MPLFLIPLLAGTGVGAWFGFGAGDKASTIKTYTFYGVVAFAVYWFFIKRGK